MKPVRGVAPASKQPVSKRKSKVANSRRGWLFKPHPNHSPGGRGRTTIVRRSSSLDSLYFFKGVDFGAFLESSTDYEHRKNVCCHQIRTVSSLPTHPNILSPATTFVTVGRLGMISMHFSVELFSLLWRWERVACGKK